MNSERGASSKGVPLSEATLNATAAKVLECIKGELRGLLCRGVFKKAMFTLEVHVSDGRVDYIKTGTEQTHRLGA